MATGKGGAMTSQLSEIARKLELQLATEHLLLYLFPDFDKAKKQPGRYRFFGHIIEKHPQLLQALLDNKPKFCIISITRGTDGQEVSGHSPKHPKVL
jgi:hypothetical protein